mmetsp:Transcript_16157/g.15876  ORF Transcript_16157/g.15876 Transcript_16157/m.15876 type:complete len:761 (+) Transcript_16157:22-2304(+)
MESQPPQVEKSDVNEEKKLIEDKKQRAKKIVTQVFCQLTKGCGREFCTNKDCASNKMKFKDRNLTEKEALKIAIQFVKTMGSDSNKIKLCPSATIPKTIQIEELAQLSEATKEDFEKRFLEVFSSPFTLSFSFLKDREIYLKTDTHNIDFDKLSEFYKIFDAKFDEEERLKLFTTAGENFVDSFKKESKDIEEPWILRSFLINFENPDLMSPSFESIIDRIAYMLESQLNKKNIDSHLKEVLQGSDQEFIMEELKEDMTVHETYKIQSDILVYWLSKLDKERFLDHIRKFQNILSINIFNESFNSENVLEFLDTLESQESRAFIRLLSLLDIYHGANVNKEPEDQINYLEFNNDGFNKEMCLDVDLGGHYEVWVRAMNFCDRNDVPFRKYEVTTFCNYPWLLDTTAKGEIMMTEAKIYMQQMADEELANIFIQGLSSQNPGINNADMIYLQFKVRRDFIIEDTLNNLIREGINLKKQLKVEFEGELGQDEGGVQKEFFQILVRDLFKPEYTMFNYFKDSKLVWFNGETFESNIKFELIGVLMGLAIYNGVILDIHFPVACYKKLLNIEPTLDDIKELDPSTGKSLQYILDCDSPTLQDDLYMTFIYEYEVFGENKTEALKENGANIFVSQENKQEYVELLIDFIFNKSIENQFEAFSRGFHKACGGDALTLFRPEELQKLICGSQKLDFEAMMKETRYDGFEGEEEVLNWFWDILIDEFNEEQQKKFLFFCTGCAKAPVSGLESIGFIIVKNGEDDEKLP